MKNYPPFLLSYLKLWSRTRSTKKTASKNIDFWPSYARSKFGFFPPWKWRLDSGEEDVSICDVTGGQTVRMVYSKSMTLCKKYCKVATIFCLRKHSKTISEVKRVAESEKMGFIIWKWTQHPVWRHQLGFGQIWVNSLNF